MKNTGFLLVYSELEPLHRLSAVPELQSNLLPLNRGGKELLLFISPLNSNLPPCQRSAQKPVSRTKQLHECMRRLGAKFQFACLLTVGSEAVLSHSVASRVGAAARCKFQFSCYPFSVILGNAESYSLLDEESRS